MGVIIFLLLASSLLRGKASSQTCSVVTGSLPEYNHVSETYHPGTMIFNVSKSSPVNISYNINNTSPPVLQTYFRDFQNDSLFIFYLNKTLDLEELYSLLGTAPGTISFTFSCESLKKTIYLIISSENEFYPCINISGNLNIPENTTVGTVVYNLLERTSDKDRPVSGSFFYDLVNNREDKFRIVSASSGEIRLASPLDYESGQRGYFLNISVKDTADSTARTSFASLWINVTDMDDQGPQYDYPDCVAPCLIPEYTAITNLLYTGPLKVQPASIRAHDLDTLNFSIAYSFYDGSSGASSNNDNTGFFRIDQNTGTLYQLKPASEALWASKRLVVIAAEVGSSQAAAISILMVRVRERDPTLNATDVVSRESNKIIDTDNSLLSAVIAVSVLTGIILITSAIIIFLMQRRHRKMVSPEDTRSEPSTEEEEIHSKISEEKKIVLPTRAKTLGNDLLTSVTNPLSDPMFLNGLLTRQRSVPPLGTSIGTKIIKKKKRSKRRLKKKEHEIFDGTKDYNLEVGPESFESPGKSRIEISSRSVKAPAEHAVVRNGNAEYVD